MPLRVDGTPVSLTGRFRYEPPSGAAVARLTSASAPAPGVRVTLLPGDVPGLLVANAGREALTVLGVDDEPFLRIGPDGVAAYLRSRTWRESGRAGTQATVDDNADGPRWQAVASVPRYSWIDPRTRIVTAARRIDTAVDGADASRDAAARDRIHTLAGGVGRRRHRHFATVKFTPLDQRLSRGSS